jgi:flagellar biogenesis protein FliO
MDFLYITIALLGVLGLMFLSFFGLRMLNRRISVSGGRLRVIDRVAIGRDSMILVVSVCGKLILVGVSQQKIEKLDDLDITEEEYVEAAFANSQKVLPFSDILSSIGITRKNSDKSRSISDEKKEIKKDEDEKN